MLSKNIVKSFKLKIMLTVNPYLSFNGTCEAAFNFYKSIFGGEFEYLGRYKDMPDATMPIPEEEKEKIMHVSLPLTENVTLMGADTAAGCGQITTVGDNVAITLCTESAEETKRIFNALSEGGSVTMPLEKTFFATLFGSLVDQFGINWLLNYDEDPNK